MQVVFIERWSLAGYRQYTRQLPIRIMCSLLPSVYIDCLKRDQYLLISLFQLKISLNKECPDLGLGLGYDTPDQEKRFDFCKSGLRGVSDKTFLRAYEDKLRVFSDYKRSVFGSNLHRALRTALGSSDLVQSDPLSLAGYNFDFEVLFDEDGQPIRVPMQWKYRSAGLLLASLGAGKASKPSPVKMKLPEDLLESMRETEKNECVKDPLDEGEDTPLSFDNYNCRLPSINLASDWGAKFRACPRQPVRRVVVEANGYHHYASNCDHLLGSTVLKKRQCEALGWEVIGVSYACRYSGPRIIRPLRSKTTCTCLINPPCVHVRRVTVLILCVCQCVCVTLVLQPLSMANLQLLIQRTLATSYVTLQVF